MKVLIAGGGTAGHVFPALAVASELVAGGDEVRFVGTDRGIERTVVPAAGFSLTTVEARPFPRKPSLQALVAPVAALAAARQCRPVVEWADVVLGMGGYAAAPALLAARRERRPIVIHEQNAVPGIANRLCARWASVVAVSYEESRTLFWGSAPIEVTGNPVRPQVRFVPERRRELRAEAVRAFDLEDDRQTVLVLGGSQGARRLNEALVDGCEALVRRLDIQILALTGEVHEAGVIAGLSARGLSGARVRVVPFLERIELAYALADLVVARAGASTIAEIAVCGLPSVLVPYPYATGGHQAANAQALVRAGGAITVRDEDWNGRSFSGLLGDLLEDAPRRQALGSAAAAWSRPGAAGAVTALLRKAAG